MAHKVLVFESDASFAAELRTELSKTGCIVQVVDDGNAGLTAAANDKPDLILLSIELPRMNGFSVCNKLKKDNGLKDVPLIIMSSESSDETFEQHRKLRTRAEDYVHKPIALGELWNHIRALVPGIAPIGAAGPYRGSAPPDSAGIEIDDGILIEEDVEGRSGNPPPLDAPTVSAKDAEAEIGVADVVTKSEEPPAAKPGTVPPRAASIPPRAPSIPPPQRGSAPPSEGTMALESELRATKDALSRAETRVADLERDSEGAGNAKDEIAKLTRDLEEARSRAASGGKPSGGVSSREFLDLREALNKKDKEILSLKEALSKKDKEIVDVRDKSLALERSKSELDDKVLETERELADAREKVDALAADKEQAKKAGEDFKARMQRAQTDADARTKELAEAREKQAQDLAAKDEEASQAKAAAAKELESALEDARRAQESALAAQKESLEKTAAEALAAREAELRVESDNKLAALHRANQAELEKTRRELEEKAESERGEAAAQHETALSDAKASHESTMAEAAAKHEAAAADAASKHAEAVRAIEEARDAKVAAIEAAAAAADREAKEKIAALEAEIALTNEALKTATERGVDLNQKLTAMTESRDSHEKAENAAKDRAIVLEADVITTKRMLEETKTELTRETSRHQKAVAKWDADRASLERAKDALAVVLSQIEEAEARPLASD